MKKFLISGAAVAVVSIFAVGVSAALAANPPGTGQPGAPAVSCGQGNAVTEPQGFSTTGFVHAQAVYAGSPGTPSLANAQSAHAIAQYDVACFQLTAK